MQFITHLMLCEIPIFFYRNLIVIYLQLRFYLILNADYLIIIIFSEFVIVFQSIMVSYFNPLTFRLLIEDFTFLNSLMNAFHNLANLTLQFIIFIS